MKIIDRKHLCTFITLRDRKIMKFLCLVLNFQKIMKILSLVLNFWPRLYFDGGRKASLYCILRDRRKNARTVLIPQSNLNNTGPRAGTIHKQLC